MFPKIIAEIQRPTPPEKRYKVHEVELRVEITEEIRDNNVPNLCLISYRLPHSQRDEMKCLAPCPSSLFT